MNVLSKLRNLRDLTTQIINKMPIAYNFENDSVALMVLSKFKRRSIEKLLLTTSLSVRDIASAFEIPEASVLEIKSELDAKKSKK